MTTLFFNNINLGITSKCNAGCDYCNRKTFKDFPNMNTQMPLDTFKKILNHTNHIEFCGSYGDFINHSDGLSFLEETLKRNIKFNIETNAGCRDEIYWKELAKLCNNENAYVQFSIDDIKNERNPYRKVHTQTVLNNLDTFIKYGGYAVVKTLLFKFNEDYLEEMQSYFMKLGVKKYLKQYSMIYEEGDLSAPISCLYKQGTLPYIYTLSEKITQIPKVCPWANGKWLYILDNGEVHPCCYIVSYAAEIKDTMPFVSQYTDYDQYGELYKIYLKNKDLINLNTKGVTLESAYNNEYNLYIKNNFQNIPRCVKRCGLNNIIKDPISGIIND